MIQTQTQTPETLTEKFKKLGVDEQAFMKVILVSELLHRNKSLSSEHRMDILSSVLEVFKSTIMLSVIETMFDCPGLTDEPKANIAALGILTYRKFKETQERFSNLMDLIPREEPK